MTHGGGEGGEGVKPLVPMPMAFLLTESTNVLVTEPAQLLFNIITVPKNLIIKSIGHACIRENCYRHGVTLLWNFAI